MNIDQFSPITSVKVLRGVPLDNKYKDVLDFSSTSSQISYFTSKVKSGGTFTDLTPIRMMNKIKLPRVADWFYDCNYIMFQNANFDNKWFYAFITDVEFVSKSVAAITFEIDVYQTWQFDLTFKESYVVREHSLTDGIGDNTVPENVDLGLYSQKAYDYPELGDYWVCIATSWLPDGASGEYIGGMYSGVKYIFMRLETQPDIEAINSLLDNFASANKVDSIVSIFMIPSRFIPDPNNMGAVVQRRYEINKSKTALGSYIPTNKKMLTYPYNFLQVFEPQGESRIYRYEKFQDETVLSFILFSAMSSNFEIVALPVAYNNQQFNLEEIITMGNFPQCSYNIDTFKVYLAQSLVSSGLSLAQSLGSFASPAGYVSGALGVASNLNNVVQASQQPPSTRGNTSGNTLGASRDKNFYFVNKFVSREYAEKIDKYFTAYGYATNMVKIPNIKTRPNWNYVQLNDPKIIGSIPFNDMAKIKDIFTAGVTIWHTSDIGNYSLNNQP